MPIGAIIGGVIGGGLGLIGASEQASAVSDASNLQWQNFEQMYNDLAPWRLAGNEALDRLMFEMGIPLGGAPVAPSESSYYYAGGIAPPESSYYYAGGGGGTGDGTWQDLQYQTSDWAPPSNASNGATWTTPGGTVYTYQNGNWVDLGGYNQALGNYNTALRQYNNMKKAPLFGILTDPSKFKGTPQYNWELQKGEDAIKAAQAAGGKFFSGDTGTALENYATGLANEDYNNWATNMFNRLAALASAGQGAVSETGQAGMNAATTMGNFGMAGAQAQAGGWQNFANQFMGGIGAYNNYNMMNGMMGGGGWSDGMLQDPNFGDYFMPGGFQGGGGVWDSGGGY